MIKKLLLSIYNILPTKFRNKIGRSSVLKPLRNTLLRPNGNYAEAKVMVERKYLNYYV